MSTSNNKILEVNKVLREYSQEFEEALVSKDTVRLHELCQLIGADIERVCNG